MGCPVLIGASPENAARELVKEGMNGYTFSLQDPMDATVKIETILGATDAARRQMSQVSVALSWAHDSSKCVDRVEQIYAELAGIPSG